MQKPLRVLYVHHGSGLGGAPISLSFLLDRVDKTQIDASLLCIFKGPVLKVFEEKDVNLYIDERIFPFHGSTVSGMSFKLFLLNFRYLPQSIYYAYKFIQKFQPHVIHLNSSSLFAVALAAKLVNSKIKVICHIREPLLSNSLCASIIRTMNYYFVNRFVSIDHFSASTMKSKQPIEVVHNSVDFATYNSSVRSDALRRRFGLKTTDIVFLYLARISKSNGTLELIEVIERLVLSNPNFHFIIAGFREEEVEKSYVSKVKERIANITQAYQLEFTSDVPSIIADSDVMLVPFTEPHFARSIIEASAIGVPTIGKNIGGVKELVVHEKTGFLYDSSEELEKFCLILGTDRTLRVQMGKEAERMAKREFDHKTNALRTFDLYND